MKFADECRKITSDGWETYENHPWFADLAAGTLTVDRFLAFQVNDAPFVPQIHRTLAIGLSKAPSGSAWSRVATTLMADYFVADETNFKQKILAELGVTSVRFDPQSLMPEREAYANHMLRTALDGGIGEIAAVLLPCAAFSHVVGARFRDVEIKGPEPFRAWAHYYANKAGYAISEAHAQMMDDVAEGGPEIREKMLFAYARSLQHQIRVFDAAYYGYPGWPRTGVAPVDGEALTGQGPA